MRCYDECRFLVVNTARPRARATSEPRRNHYLHNTHNERCTSTRILRIACSKNLHRMLYYDYLVVATSSCRTPEDSSVVVSRT